MFGFPRSKSRPEPRSVVRATDTLEGLADLLQGWLKRMEDLLHARSLATPPGRVSIDEQIERLRQEATEEIEKTGHGELTKRIRRMKQLTLDEITEQWDKARRENP